MLVPGWARTQNAGETPVVARTSEWKELTDGNEEKDTAPGTDRGRGNRRRRAHHHSKKQQEQADDQAYADDEQDDTQYAPAPADPTDQIEHLAKLHESGALTDEEFAAAKAKALGI